MAKPRKTKAEDSGPLIRHQKLCLFIDLDKRRIHGYTEMEVAVPDSGVIGLHADNLEIESILVDGERVEYECFPHYQPVELENRWCSVSTAASAAEAAAATYLGVLEKETMPNLIIYCCPPISQVSEQQTIENGEPSPSDEQKQNVRLVRISYWVDKAETGVHFEANMLYTDNQIRRAGCWFPCLDHTYQQCCYDMEFTVGHNLVAVSTGSLLRQVLSKDDPPLKTYVYKVDVAVAARWISLAVGPFEILPDQHSGLISHMCLPPYLSLLRNTVGFFYAAFSHYEDYLSASFPFGSYKQVFIPPEMIISSLNLGASMGIFSSQVLFDEKIIDQTIETRIKIALALARQWFGVYITAESPNDEWLLAGLAGYMTDSFIKHNLGNNEARYRRFKANSAVSEMDDSGATALSPSSFKDLYGTEFIGLYGKIRAWKSVAVLQMLEKQMGPESFRKILQRIVSRAGETAHLLRTLSTKEFRQYANKIGNLDRPFLKEFFPRWVGSCGCPVLRTGLSYNKRKNLVELAVLRECSATPESIAASVSHTNTDSESREGDGGWPGMMSIRVHELDGTYDHPILPMAGETWQLLEIQCHSKIASKRFQKPRKSSKPDGSDDNGDGPSALDTRSNGDSPLLWLRADPEMEYLAEIHFNQPIHMWINQLENDKDVVAQAQAIEALEALPQLPFSVVNALNAFLSDSKAFWRVRVDAAFSLASTASEETDWAGLLHLVKFFQSRRFDSKIGLPKPNDFRDFPEYFVLGAIPHAISMVRASDMKSPREAVEFILQLLKYNDNSGNPYSDVFWLAALIESVGELEFGQQSILFLSSLLKRIDRLLQFDRLMPSYNGILTISCIRTLTRIGLRLAGLIPLDRISELIKPFRDLKTLWQVRVEASRSLLEIELHSSGIDAALLMFIKYLEEEPSLRGQIKLGSHAVRLCQTTGRSECKGDAKSSTLVVLLRLLESRIAFNNVFLRHHLFCILQVLAKRSPTLYGVPRPQTFQLSYLEACCEQFAALATQSKSSEPPIDIPNISNEALPISEAPRDLINDRPPDTIMDNLSTPDVATVEVSAEKSNLPEPVDASNPSDAPNPSDVANPYINALPIPEPEPEPSREVDTISNSHEHKKSFFKFRVKQSAASSRADDVDNLTSEKSHQGAPNEAERVASSSNSVEAPMRNLSRAAMSVSDNQNIEEANSCYDHGSRMSVSIGSVKIVDELDELGKELQCTADSSIASVLPLSGDNNKADSSAPEYVSVVTLSNLKPGEDGSSMAAPDANLHGRKEKKKKKDKEKKRKREEHKGRHDDPEYLERKRLKKEKKQKEKKQKEKLKDKEMSVLRNSEPKARCSEPRMLISEPKQLSSEPKLLDSEQKQVSDGLQGKSDADMLKDITKDESRIASAAAEVKPSEPSRSKVVVTRVESKPEASEGTSAPPKFRIKLKGRTLGSSK